MVAGARPLSSLDEALSLLLEACVPVESTGLYTLDAVEKTVAEDLVAATSLPKSNVALREGWAVRAQDTYGATSLTPNFLPAAPPFVALGETLPEGADAVLPGFGLTVINGMAEILAAAVPGESIRRTGEDLLEAEVIVSAGEKLNIHQALILRLAEIDEVPVFLPRVAIFAGNTEGSVSTAEWLAHLARVEGARTEIITSSNKGQEILEAFTRSDADLTVFLFDSGGDLPSLAIQALSDSGLTLAQGLAIRPGESISCGLLTKPTGPLPIPAIFASQRFENVLAAWLFLIRPCLDRLMNKTPHRRGEILTLNRKIASSLGRSELVLLQVQKLQERRVFEPLGIGDFTWSAVGKATHWLSVPPESEGYARDEVIFGEFL